MSQCSACSPCGDTPNSVFLMKKLDNMIGDNYTLLFILIVVLVILGLALTYFLKSLITTIQAYQRGKKQQEIPAGDNPRSKFDDSYTYYPTAKEDPENATDVKIPENKGKFVDELETRYKDVTKEQGEFIKANYGGRNNDDPLDRSTLFAAHDKYRYDKEDDAA